jgi:hypothetical protein
MLKVSQERVLFLHEVSPQHGASVLHFLSRVRSSDIEAEKTKCFVRKLHIKPSKQNIKNCTLHKW